MNTDLLKSKMKEYFRTISPEQLIETFEKMGYSFVEIAEPTPSAESMEDVLKKHFLRFIVANPNEDIDSWEEQNPLHLQFMYDAMSEYASIKCTEKNNHIKGWMDMHNDLTGVVRSLQLKLSIKEEAVKELMELLDRIVSSGALERAKRFDLNNSAKYLITKHKTP